MGSWKTLVGKGARTTHSSMSCLSTFCSPFLALLPCHRIPMSEKKIGKDRLPLFCVIWLYNSQAIWDEWYYICIMVETLDLPTTPPSLSLLSIYLPHSLSSTWNVFFFSHLVFIQMSFSVAFFLLPRLLTIWHRIYFDWLLLEWYFRLCSLYFLDLSIAF